MREFDLNAKAPRGIVCARSSQWQHETYTIQLNIWDIRPGVEVPVNDRQSQRLNVFLTKEPALTA
jgi:hypothetical protein